MTKAMASDWNTYKKEFTGDKGDGDERAARPPDVEGKAASGRSRRDRRNLARLGLRIGRHGHCALGRSKDSKNAAAKQLILDEWEQAVEQRR